MRANGEGTIRQRKNGLWEGRVMVDGKQLSYYSRRHKDVVESIRQARESIVNNEPPPLPSQSKRTVGQVAEEWLATKKLRNNTLSAYKAYLRNHILPEFAAVQLGALTPGRIERFLNTRKKKGSDEPLSAKSAQQMRAILQSLLSFAMKEGYIRRNVAQLADAPEVVPTKISPFTPTQIPMLLGAISGARLEPLYLLMLGTGMREGECLGLTLEDLDLENRLVSIRHTLERDQEGNYQLVAMAKNKTSYRDVHLPTSIASRLEKWLERREADKKAAKEEWADEWGLLFVTPLGRPLHRSTVLHDFQRLIVRAALPRKSLYNLRHSHASLLIHDGATLMDVKEQLGHSQIHMTANVYGHLFDERKRATAALIEARLGGKLERPSP